MKYSHIVKFSFASALFLSAVLTASLQAQTTLHDSVPYQDHSLLENPITGQLIDSNAGDDLLLECDWPTLLSMIRDLEERIATAAEIDTSYGIYVSGQVEGNRIFMNYDCFTLRDSVLSLQIQLDEALASEPGMQTRSVIDIAQTVATIRGAVIDDGNVDLESWGFLWGTDVTSLDSINVDFTLDNIAYFDTSALDTGSYHYTLSDLERYTTYYFTAVGANEEGPGYGDTLSFTTLPDTASGFTLDTANVTNSSVQLRLSVTDAGGQGPDSTGFYFDNASIDLSAFSGDTLVADGEDDGYFTLDVSGLTRYTDYYVRGFADNLAGRGNSEEAFTFRTLPELPDVSAQLLEFNGMNLGTLTGSVPPQIVFRLDLADNGGMSPTIAFELSTDETFTSPDTLFSAQSFFDESLWRLSNTVNGGIGGGLDWGRQYWFTGSAANDAGITRMDTVMFRTPAAIFTGTASFEVDETNPQSQLNFSGDLLYENALPDSMVFSTDSESDWSYTLSSFADGTFNAEFMGFSPGERFLWRWALHTDNTWNTMSNAAFTAPKLHSWSVGHETGLSVLQSTTLAQCVSHWTNGRNALCPLEVGFVWSDQSDLSDPIAVIPGEETYVVSGDSVFIENAIDLPGAQIYFSAFADMGSSENTFATIHNSSSAGNVRVYGDTLGAVTLAAAQPESHELLADGSLAISASTEWMDLVGQPTEVGFAWSSDASFPSNSRQDTTLDFSLVQADSTFSISIPNFDISEDIYFTAFATNTSGTAYGDTLARVTLTDDNIHSAVNMYYNGPEGEEAAANMYGGAISDWDVSNVTDMSALFFSKSFFNDDISNWDVSGVVNMDSMFMLCSEFNQAIGSWDVGNVTSMESMFFGAIAFNQPLDGWDVSNVSNMKKMFFADFMDGQFNQDLNNWDVSSVTDMSSMFWNNAFNGNVSAWDVSAVTDMSYMFAGGGIGGPSGVFNQDLSGWDVSSVVNMSGMFQGNPVFNSDLSTWNTSSVASISSMFNQAFAFDQNLASWNVSNVNSAYQMFGDPNSGFVMSLSQENYDALLQGWSTQTLQPNVTFSAKATYCDGADARQTIIDTFGWTVSDQGEDCPLPCIPVSFDGYDYDVVEIGDQCWFAENLRTTIYADGTSIPGELEDGEWGSTTEGGQAILDQGGINEPQNLNNYGRLYNFYAVGNSAGLCPTGWHVPTDAEFSVLEQAFGGMFIAGERLKSSANDTPSWNGGNSSGWSGLPGGSRNYITGAFANGTSGLWWSSTQLGGVWVPIRILNEDNNIIDSSQAHKRTGASVRCIQDE